MKESAIQSKIMKYLLLEGAECNKTIGMSKAGWPDIVGCMPMNKEQALKYFETHDYIGVFIGPEVKRPGQKATPLQEFKLNKLREAGACAGVVTSVSDTQTLLVDFGILPSS